MRPVMLLLALLALAGSAHAQDWTTIPLGTTAELYAVENTNLAPRWVVGAGGFAALSNAARTTWTRMAPGTTAALYSVAEPIPGEVWMGAGQGVVRIRVGTSWFARDLPSQADYRLFTGQSGLAVAVGSGGIIYRTADGGFLWFRVLSGTTADLNAGIGMPYGAAWAVGSGGTILKTLTGNSWSPVPSGTTASLYGVAELNATDVYAVGDGGTILKSTDAGSTWSARPSGTTANLRAVSISKQNDANLIAVGLGGVILKSTDRGDTWCLLNSGTTADLFGAEAVSDTEFIVCGSGGLLLRTTNGGGPCTGTSVDPAGPEARLVVAGPFPQPSSAAALLRLTAPAGQSFRAEVFDVSGRAILRLPEFSLGPAGERAITLDTRGWPSGVYLVRVRGEAGEAVRRLVVTR